MSKFKLYSEESMRILEDDATFNGYSYCVRVNGKFLTDPDTMGLREKIEAELRKQHGRAA